jgi:uncharacterized protein YlxP (DUF503 family)
MVVAACVVKINLNGVRSLKEKRRILKSILTRLRQQFNLATAEIDYHEVWQTTLIGLVAVGNDTNHLHSLLEKAVAWIGQARPDLPIEDYTIEFR